MQLGGAPPQLYDQARDGVVDLVWTLPGNTPGRFPVSETFELPFVPHRKAVPNSRALQEFAEAHMKDEFKEVHPICFWAHDHGLIHANKSVKVMEDLKGLKLRFPTRLAGEALRALGATAIGMPIPQLPESLAQRVIDGAVVPWEVVPSDESARARQEPHGDPRFPDPLYRHLRARDEQGEVRGPAGGPQAGDRRELGPGRRRHGGQGLGRPGGRRVSNGEGPREQIIYVLTAEEAARWRKATEPVIENWLKTTKERGLDGQKLLDDARAAIKKHEGAA